MPRVVRSARGELVDFDAIVIKQQLAQAPMNVEVERRKNFIDSKESTGRKASEPAQPVIVVAPTEAKVSPADFEIEAPKGAKLGPVAEPVPDLPVRKK